MYVYLSIKASSWSAPRGWSSEPISCSTSFGCSPVSELLTGRQLELKERHKVKLVISEFFFSGLTVKIINNNLASPVAIGWQGMPQAQLNLEEYPQRYTQKALLRTNSFCTCLFSNLIYVDTAEHYDRPLPAAEGSSHLNRQDKQGNYHPSSAGKTKYLRFKNLTPQIPAALDTRTPCPCLTTV